MTIGQGYGREIDLWMLGVYAYEISNYTQPFKGPEIRDKLKVKYVVKAA